MKTTTRIFGIVAVLSGFTFLAGAGNALGGVVLSDELLLTNPAGAVAADILIPEGGAPGTEPSAVFAPAAVPPLNGLIGPGQLAALAAGGVANPAFVILSEPPGEPLDPNELPPVIFLGPNGPVVVSDLLVSGVSATSGPFVAFISDNNPDLAAIVGLIPQGAPVPILAETGLLQDVSPAVQGAFPGFRAQVRSDISVPEPSSIVILLGFAGLGAIGSIRRCRRLA